ncbi:MAG: hypothetical protein AAF264_00960, partial [Pseudomonadota bacterium]
GFITDGGTIDSSTLDGGDLAIAARMDGVDISTVGFTLDGEYVRHEGKAPYSLFGDVGTDLTGGTLADGEHTIKVTVKDKAGRVVTSDEFDFELVDETPAPAPEPDPKPEPDPLLRVFLADAKTDKTLAEITGGGVIDRADLEGHDLTAYAVAGDDTDVGSVRFAGSGNYDGIVENVSPYAIFGDVGGDFASGSGVFEGNRVDLNLTAYSGAKGAGKVLEEVEIGLVLAGPQGPDATIDFL